MAALWDCVNLVAIASLRPHYLVQSTDPLTHLQFNHYQPNRSLRCPKLKEWERQRQKNASRTPWINTNPLAVLRPVFQCDIMQEKKKKKNTNLKRQVGVMTEKGPVSDCAVLQHSCCNPIFHYKLDFETKYSSSVFSLENNTGGASFSGFKWLL